MIFKNILKILTILFLSVPLFAKMGNCFECHPLLKNDTVHSGMATCIKCHTKTNIDALRCGDECFRCHTSNDMDTEHIPEHEVFEECRECHVLSVHDTFDTSIPSNQSYERTLQDFLK